MAYRNGGGAFLIPYFTMYFLAGMPCFFMELGIGQFTSKSAATTYEMTPMLKGVGWSMVLMSLISCLYYNFIISWILHYLFGSLRSKLVWHKCDNSWNNDFCIDRDTVFGVETHSIKNNVSMIYCNSTSDPLTDNCTKGVFGTSQYFYNYVLGISDSINNYGTPSWSLTLCLLFAWIFVAICLMFGIKSSGKVVYVTATFPYVVLVILLIRGVTLEGSLNGVLYYIKPNFKKILEIKTWFQAASQVFFSLGIASGSLQLYSSFNPFHNNTFGDALLISILDSITSTIGGFAIFSVLGYMSHINKLSIDKLVEAGTGLAFIIYPEALSSMPAGPLFAVLFFLMLFTLGIDSQFAFVETVFKPIQEVLKLPESKKPYIVCICSCILFLVSICFCCPGGFYLFEILNYFSSGQVLLILALTELIMINYIYGFNNFMEDVKLMLKGRRFEYYWLITLCFITPVLLIAIIVLMSINFETPIVNGRPLPDWAVNFGWFISAVILVPIPSFAIYEIVKAYKIRHLIKRDDMPLYLVIFKHINKPSMYWGPSDKKSRMNHRYKNMITNDKQDIDFDNYDFGIKTSQNHQVNQAFDNRSESLVAF